MCLYQQQKGSLTVTTAQTPRTRGDTPLQRSFSGTGHRQVGGVSVSLHAKNNENPIVYIVGVDVHCTKIITVIEPTLGTIQ